MTSIACIWFNACLDPGSFREYFKSPFQIVLFEPNGAQNKLAKETADFNVSVLVYTMHQIREEHMRELKSEGNFRNECNLDFDCIYNMKYNHDVTADMFYSMDAVIVGLRAADKLRQLFPFRFWLSHRYLVQKLFSFKIIIIILGSIWTKKKTKVHSFFLWYRRYISFLNVKNYRCVRFFFCIGKSVWNVKLHRYNFLNDTVK